jgi:hypothetical protein
VLEIEFDWKPWLYQVPPNYWTDMKNQRRYFDWLEEEFGLESKEDWYKVKWVDIIRKRGDSILDIYDNSLCRALQVSFLSFRNFIEISINNLFSGGISRAHVASVVVY